MRLDLSELRAHLKRGLEKLYVVHGDELLLTLEASDLIRRACRANEFEERTVLVAESRFDWTQLKDQALAISLFSSKKLVDLRIPGGKPGKSGQ
jgi:DNA polymerase-3 subunit delta